MKHTNSRLVKGVTVFRYKILIVQTTKDILAESIAISIKNTTDIDLISDEVINIQELENFIREKDKSPDIVILIGHALELEIYINELLESYATIVVASVAIGSEVVQINLRQLDVSELILSVCNLCKLHSGKLTHRLTEFEVVSKSELTDVSDVHFGLAEIRSPQSSLIKALKWLDSLLNLYLHTHSSSKNDLPGLSISRTTIENLLQTGSEENDSSLSKQNSAVNLALKELLDDINNPKLVADPFVSLCKGFGFTILEIQTFLLCLSPDLSTKYERIFGFINDDIGRRNATIGLISSLLGETLNIRMELANSSIFSRWGLLGTYESFFPHGDASLRVDPQIISWVLGNRTAILQNIQRIGIVQSEPWVGASWIKDPTALQIVENLRSILSKENSGLQWIVLQSSDSSGLRAIVERMAQITTTSLLRISLSAFDNLDEHSAKENITSLGWIARLMGSLPVIYVNSSVSVRKIKQLMNVFDGLKQPCMLIINDLLQVIDALSSYEYRVYEHNAFSNLSSTEVFLTASTEKGMSLSAEDCEQLACAYPLPFDGIDRALRLSGARDNDFRQSNDQLKLVADACRDVASPELPRFAIPIETNFKLEDVVLPEDRIQQLNDIVTHVTYSQKVLNQWGFNAQLPYGKGVAVLFSGPSGVGKTMAACAIAQTLKRNIFSVDLSRIVSKYIGETEKNLDVVFLEAEHAGAILLFDEADALFGKRSEVKDAHDRYANIETAYLLQRMEAFRGLAILTTNFGHNLDKAFIRRLRFVVEFPSPDVAAREKIWRQCFPPEAPVANDIDFNFLARRIEINGGNIRQITLRAAFDAAAEGKSISLNHILKATRAEVLKLGMPGLARELCNLAA